MSAIIREKISLFAICCVWETLFGLKMVVAKEGKKIVNQHQVHKSKPSFNMHTLYGAWRNIFLLYVYFQMILTKEIVLCLLIDP